MIYKSLFIQVLLRVILILLNAVAFSWVILSTRFWYSIVTLGVLLILQTWLMVRYLNRTNRIMADFIQRLREKESTTRSLLEIESGPFQQFTQLDGALSNHMLFLHENFTRVIISDIPGDL